MLRLTAQVRVTLLESTVPVPAGTYTKKINHKSLQEFLKACVESGIILSQCTYIRTYINNES